jgi:hypothetical protein
MGKLGLDFKLDVSKNAMEVAKTMWYTVKSGNQLILRQVTNHYLLCDIEFSQKNVKIRSF